MNARPEDSAYIRDWLRASHDPTHPAWQTPTAPARGAYLGEAPSGLAKIVLDRYVMPRLSHGRRPHRADYWATEVEEAQVIAASWARCGMPADEVVRWIALLNAACVEQAAALFAEGIHPEDLEADGADHGRPSLATRLVVGNMSVGDVLAEIERRRAS